jgi:GT2 family glycosyltransferase
MVGDMGPAYSPHEGSEHMTPEASIVIVSYNTRDLTLACLASLPGAADGVTYEVTLVDNASHDGTVEAVAAEYPEVRVIPLGVNLGFGQAVNLGVAASSGGCVVLLNPDARLTTGSLGSIVRISQSHADAGPIGGRVLRADGSIDFHTASNPLSLRELMSSAFGFGALRNRMGRPNGVPRAALCPGVHRVGMVSGAFMAIRRDLWNELGGFRSRFFMYGEDADLCERARAAGAVPLLATHAVAIHESGSSSSTANKRILSLAGRVTYVKAHWPRWKAWVGLRVLVVHVVLRAICTGRKSGWREVWAQRAGWIHGYRCGRPRSGAPAPALGGWTHQGLHGEP